MYTISYRKKIKQEKHQKIELIREKEKKQWRKMLRLAYKVQANSSGWCEKKNCLQSQLGIIFQVQPEAQIDSIDKSGFWRR